VATTKLSLTLDADLVDEARRHVGERGLSRYVSDALRLRLQRDRLEDWLAEAGARSGPLPAEAVAAAEALWPDA
jgi:post-segregation antitoxin (ccd killing protein)